MASRSNPWLAGMGLPIIAVAQCRGEDSIGYAHETYAEDHGRMTVQTDSLRVHSTISPWFDLTFRGVYDGISGATPIGAPAIDQLTLRNPKTHESIPPSTLTGYTRPLNGVSGASPVNQAIRQDIVPLAHSDDIRRGIDLSAGIDSGPNRFIPEFSYSRENDYISYAGAINYLIELNNKNTRRLTLVGRIPMTRCSATNSHTSIWFQKLGQSLVVSPSFRYYRQGAAHFYGIQFPGDPANDPARVPSNYSSDYRLSFLETFTLGLETSIRLRDHWNFHLGYQRYWMHGLDHVTLQSTYPSANIFSIGLDFTY